MTPSTALHSLRTHRPRTAVAVGGLLALSMALGACGGGSSDETSNTTDSAPGDTSAVDTLKLANAVAIDTLDPIVASANESIWLDQNIYARLVQNDPAGTTIVPDLAESWDISDDKLTYTFHLRPDVMFADGTPVTAQDAKWSIERARDGEDASWGFLISPVTDIQATDDKTLTITLSTPHAPLLADLAMYAYAILPQKAVEADEDFFTKTPYGAGPFKVTSLSAQSKVVLSRNDNYWGPKPKISTVEVSIVTDDNTRLLQLQGGEVDVIENPAGNVLKQIEANPKLNVNLFDSTRVDFVSLPLKTKPFDNLKVRQAVKAALDLGRMNTLAYQGNAEVATTFFPYKMLYWDASAPEPKQDLEKAKQLLSEAGYPDGFTVPLIAVSADAAGQAQAVTIKDDLAKIGITVDIQSYELSTAYDKQRPGTNGMGMRYWTNDIIDPDEVATFGADGDGGANAFNSYWKDPAVTDMVNQARSETDDAKRAELYAKIQTAIADQAPFIPLAYAPFRYASGTWVKGFQVSPLGNYNDSLLTLTVEEH